MQQYDESICVMKLRFLTKTNQLLFEDFLAKTNENYSLLNARFINLVPFFVQKRINIR